MTQEDLVYEYMKKNGGITSMEAFQHIGCTRLSAKIFNLRHQKGHVILQDYIQYTDKKTGRQKRFARYYIAREGASNGTI